MVRVTRTPLAGGGSTVITQEIPSRFNRILRARITRAMSVGDQSAFLELDNLGDPYTAWASADSIKIETRGAGDASWVEEIDGFIAEPVRGLDHPPTLGFEVYGPNALLRRIYLTQDHTFTATAWTTMYDTLCSTYLTGYTRTITADAATGTTKFTTGMNLGQVLDIIRKSLIAATAQRWESIALRSAGTKEIKLFKRSTSSQATIKAKDLLRGGKQYGGSAFDLVNKATVIGATLPQKVTDKTGLTLTASYRLDTTTERVAQPFTADDTPLYAVTAKADRSVTTDPPTLEAYVMRNSDHVDAVRASKILGASRLRTHASLTNPNNLTDGDDATAAGWPDFADATYREVAVWDLGATPPTIEAWRIRIQMLFPAPYNLTTLRLSYSDDDSAWTVAASRLSEDEFARTYISQFTAQTRRYWRLEISDGGSGNGLNIYECGLLQYANLSTDVVSDPEFALTDAQLVRVSVSAGQTKELIRFDFRSPLPMSRVSFKNTSFGNAYSKWQKSSDGATWLDLSLHPNTGGIQVLDTVNFEAGDFRYARLVGIKDSGGGADNVETVDTRIYLHTSDAFSAPLTGDKLRGSTLSWGVESLVDHPALLEEKMYPAPRLTLITGRLYWLVFEAKTGASASSFWDMQYGTETGANDALKSTDSGATWSAIAADAVLLHKISFNNRAIEGTSQDTASQTKYANFIPGGILYGSIVDEGLLTNDVVEKMAAAIVAVRADVTPRQVVPTRLLPSVDVGSRVTLDPDVDLAYGSGISGAKDVLEHHLELIPAAKSVLVLGDRPARATDADRLIANIATRRTL